MSSRAGQPASQPPPHPNYVSLTTVYRLYYIIYKNEQSNRVCFYLHFKKTITRDSEIVTNSLDYRLLKYSLSTDYAGHVGIVCIYQLIR